MDEITSNVCDVDTVARNRILRMQPQLVTSPVGKVDMKIGSDCSELLTKVVKAVGSLQLLESQFGYCIRGRLTSVDSHRDYTKSGCKLNHISIDSSTS